MTSTIKQIVNKMSVGLRTHEITIEVMRRKKLNSLNFVDEARTISHLLLFLTFYGHC